MASIQAKACTPTNAMAIEACHRGRLQCLLNIFLDGMRHLREDGVVQPGSRVAGPTEA
jgi:hypothetical protein